ncbi:hypothetical protein EG103P3_00002 [Enterococcus phage EG103P3]|nr:hypothetical protein EG103P3_00002 [Enterococcus phage EG103P3]
MNLKEAYNEIIKNNLNEPGYRKTYLQDLTQHGAISGMVSGLISYYETTQFFNEHRDEIVTMLDELKEETGLDESGLFGDKWRTWEEIAEDFESTVDMDDYETEDDYFHAQMKEHNEFIENIDELEDFYNKNLLAWFAVEELAIKELNELEEA